MPRIVSRTISGTSRWTSVEISPETTAIPVLTSVSQATRPSGSSAITASRTPSEIWSEILSGWPSVTDSEVKRYSGIAEAYRCLPGARVTKQIKDAGSAVCSAHKRLRTLICAASRAPPATGMGYEVDHERHSLEPVGLAHPVLQMVGPVAGDQLAVVYLDRDPRRLLPHLGGVVEAEAAAAPRRGRGPGDDVGDEAVQLRGRDPLGCAVGQLQRAWQEGGDVAAAQRRAGDDRRAEAGLALHPGAG